MRILLVFTIFFSTMGGLCAQEIANPIANNDFETGDLTGWSVSSATDGGMWALGDQGGKQGSYAVRSAGGFTGVGEENTGVLVSSSFVVPAIPDGASGLLLTFLIAGHRGEDIATGAVEDIPANRQNYVVVCAAADDQEVSERTWPPRNDAMSTGKVDVTALAGQEVYIKVVDDSPDGGFAWLAVDNFAFGVPVAPEGINGNGNFETGDLTGWTVSDAGTGAWDNQPAAIGRAGREGDYAVSSFPAGESQTGTLRSDTFTVPDGATALRFIVAGHFQYGGDPNNTGGGSVESPWNYVALYQADGAEIARVYAPGNDAFQPRSIDVTGLVGQSVYVEIVDNADSPAYGWIAADDFRLMVQAGPTCDAFTCNSGFELGDYSGWVATGAAWEAQPGYQDVSGITPFEGAYFATSRLNEGTTGTLATTPFEVTTETYSISYMANGWSSPDGNPDNGLQYNYAMLKDAADDSDLLAEKLFVGNSNLTWTPFEIDLTPFTGKTVYLEFIDDSTGGYAWMSVDAVTLFDEAAWRAMDDDDDGLTNGEEDDLGTAPLNPDTDGDTLFDGEEVNTYGTNPLLADTDGDGHDDGREVRFGTDPLDPQDFPQGLPAGGLTMLAVLFLGLCFMGMRRCISAGR